MGFKQLWRLTKLIKLGCAFSVLVQIGNHVLLTVLKQWVRATLDFITVAHNLAEQS